MKTFEELIKQRNFELEKYADVVNRIVKEILIAFEDGNRIYLFGNGGSAAEAAHIAAEFSGRFLKNRAALPAESLSSNLSTITAIANDFGYEKVFKRQVEAFVNHGDIVIALTTSGKSDNILQGLRYANRIGATTILFSGNSGGENILQESDTHIIVMGPNGTSAVVQELHLILLHMICELVDQHFPEE